MAFSSKDNSGTEKQGVEIKGAKRLPSAQEIPELTKLGRAAKIARRELLVTKMPIVESADSLVTMFIWASSFVNSTLNALDTFAALLDRTSEEIIVNKREIKARLDELLFEVKRERPSLSELELSKFSEEERRLVEKLAPKFDILAELDEKQQSILMQVDSVADIVNRMLREVNKRH